MSEGKRRVVRGQKFSNGEKENILGLVEQFGAELEGKWTDSLSCWEQQDAWMRLARSVQLCGHRRTFQRDSGDHGGAVGGRT